MTNFFRIPAFVLLLGLLLCARPFVSAANSEARMELEKTITQVLGELRRPELKNPPTREVVLAEVEKIIDRLFSFEELSSRTVGPNWASFTTDQKVRFQNSFEDLLRENYLQKLYGYNGETVSYLRESTSKSGDKVEIETQVNIKNKPVLVSYRMIKKSQWEVYDVIIEGVSMVQNYRSQFQQFMTRGDAEALISQVSKKADEARANRNIDR